MKWLMNTKRDFVAQALEGLVATTGGTPLALLSGFPEYKVVVASDWKKDRVALVSGGGSGHEPAHAGFVGEGMLTAAVAGEVFASPSVEAVLQAIAAVTGDAGCLLIVKNYTGDRLNFGLAAEKAKMLGYKVEVVIIGDDIALPDHPQPRGLAGTLFVHKIAGAAAASGASLETVAALARVVASSIASVGFSLDTCSLPGGNAERRLQEDQVEFGLGIHGEPGARIRAFEAADALIAELSDMLGVLPKLADRRLALIVNNLGGLTDLEMQVAIRALSGTSLWERTDLVIGPGTFMSSLDMRGMSISALPISEEIASWLQAPTSCERWPATVRPRISAYLPSALQRPQRGTPHTSTGPERAIIERLAETLIASEAELNTLDARVGDGDTGSTLATASRALLQKLDELPYGDPPLLLEALADILSTVMGGSSGVLMAIFCSAASIASANGASYPQALLEGLAAIKSYGGAKRGDRTMIDALEPALLSLAATGSVASAATDARTGAETTRDMDRARAGRSAYLNTSSLKGQIDPGSEAVARVFEALDR
jgi:dihydroxyacetone kinase